jgi:hypothetical protein
MPRSVEKAKRRRKRAETMAAVNALDLRYVFDAVAARLDVSDGSIHAHFKDGFITHVDLERSIRVEMSPRVGETDIQKGDEEGFSVAGGNEMPA